MPIPEKTSTQQKIILIIFGLFLCGVLLEVGLRMGGFILLSRQEYGNRTPTNHKEAYRIMCLGESTTAHGGGNAYPRQLERILNQRNTGMKFKVTNKGIGGTISTTIVAKLEDNVNKYNPDMIIVMMGINDIYAEAIAYEDIPSHKTVLFLKSFRVYKLARLLKLHIIQKLEERKLVETEEILKKALEINPRNDAACVGLANFYLEQGKFVDAEESFKKAMEINPKNSSAYVGLANYYYWDQGKLVEAEKLFKKAIEINPESDIAYVGLADYIWDQGKWREAEKLLEKALELNPKNDAAYVKLAYYYYWYPDKLVESEKLLEKALKINPKNDDIYYQQSRLSYRKNKKRKTANEYSHETSKTAWDLYAPATIYNYQMLRKTAANKGIKLVFMQYPLRSVEPLKKIFKNKEGLVFVDNEQIFKEAVARENYDKYFVDRFGKNFGHCTIEGNKLLAQNAANVILNEFLRK